jgi:hypothetical protein
MEPIFAESTSETVTAELRDRLDAAVAALPPAHCLNPTENELSVSRDAALEAQEEERQEEQGLAATNWVADTQLQPSQLSYLDADEKNSSSSDALSDASGNEDAKPGCQSGSQARPLWISSCDESEGEPRRSIRVRRATRIVESQLSLIEKGLIPAPCQGQSRSFERKEEAKHQGITVGT